MPPLPIQMLEQLNSASKALETALDFYLQTSRGIHDLYVDGQPINTIPSGLAAALAKQLPIIDLFREKLNLTAVFSGRSMNASPSLVPIHILPPEILTRIFKSVLDNNPHSHSLRGWSRNIQDLISICTYWREVAFDSPVLWTHIDLLVQVGHTDHIPMVPNLDVAKVYVERTAQMLLDVHIIDQTSEVAPEHDAACTLLVSFLASIAPRVRSLTFEARHPRPYSPIFTALFNNCDPGTLTTLVTRTDPGYIDYLDTEIDHDPELNPRILLVDVSRKRLDEIYLGLTVLELGYVYPRWTSSAYHGLTELRLKSGWIPEITESQFVTALEHSPGLRVLECAIRLAHSLEMDKTVEPIPLNDLEVVNLGRNDSSEAEAIVRWLLPGSNPLQLLISRADFYGPCLLAFLARSNITRVYLQECQVENTGAMHFVHHLPHLQTLVLAHVPGGWNPKQPETPSEELSDSLETLYVIGHYYYNLEPLHEIISLRSLRRVVFYRSDFGPHEQFLSELSALNPGAEFRIVPGNEFNPVGDWELFSPKLEQ
ncbi:hypothetical protein FRC11_012205 [Ceratobasidium sp. 423]|nr:hypothetical protein FRC11_012205 [Ceratobasidium sp. 423]